MSHRTIAVSSAIVKEMNWPLALRKMKIVNPGRTIGAMYTKQDARSKICDFAPRLTSYNKDTWLVCIAELHPIKRHHILIEAVAKVISDHPKLRLVLIGEGSERQSIEEQIARLGLKEHIFLLGNVTEAARFLKAFDMFVLASKSESYGYVLHEAGLAGIPIVATNVGGIRDIVNHNETGILIPPDNISALVQAIEKLIEQPVLAKQFSVKLSEKLNDHTVQKMTAVTQELYLLK
jgi:glycosyltransferase involved in cell wall biosynthesis